MRNYLIIGGSSGIGLELVKILEHQGDLVLATYNTNALPNRENVTYFNFNVISENIDVSQLPDEIHGLAYCPGSINLKPFHRFTEADFLADFKLQVLGATKVIQAVLPRLKNSKAASVLLFSTVAVQAGFNFHTQVAISKGAIEGLTKALAAELAPEIRVNAIAPSLTNTNLAGKLLNSAEKLNYHADKNPLKKVGRPEDVANAASFLLGEKSSWITGQIIHVDGGYSTINQ